MSTFIIAEAGSNHDGNYEQAIDCDSDYLRIGTLIFGERS